MGDESRTQSRMGYHSEGALVKLKGTHGNVEEEED
jgi:hypothetical protein